MKRRSQGRIGRKWRGGMESGPSGSISQRGTCRIMPLCASGSRSEKANAAALPALVSSQMPDLSTTVTAWP